MEDYFIRCNSRDFRCFLNLVTGCTVFIYTWFSYWRNFIYGFKSEGGKLSGLSIMALASCNLYKNYCIWISNENQKKKKRIISKLN